MQYALPYRHIAGLGGYYHHGNGSRGNRGMPVAFAAGGAAARGEHRAGQVCPFFGIIGRKYNLTAGSTRRSTQCLADWNCLFQNILIKLRMQ